MSRAQPWPRPRFPRIVGHRGAAALAPENTLAGMSAAAASGARAVELDLRLTADGAIVVLHDATLDRTTDGRGLVRRATLEEIRTLDAGRGFGREFAGERVPVLAEVLALARKLGLALALELKADRGLAVATGRAVAQALVSRRALPVVRLSGFSPRCLAAARAVAPAIPRALTVARGAPEGWIRAARALDAGALDVAHSLLTARAVARLHDAGLAVGAYTVNDPARAKALYAFGVDYVYSDDPGRITRLLR
jgi:glycerophosphoryl diester phosphodiesterase